jgi:soluble lytic murein transglycosylase-like protein
MRPRRQNRTLRLLSALLGGLMCIHLPMAMAATLERPDEEMRATLIKAIESSDSFKDRFDAEVWLTDMSQRLEPRVKDPKERLTILKTVHYEAQRAELDPELVLAVIDVESRYDRFAISSAGAQGLMQIMPFWLDEIGHPEDNLFSISTNIRLGCTILKYYLNMEKGNLYRALARYNGSLGRFWYPKLVFNALSSRWYKQ